MEKSGGKQARKKWFRATCSNCGKECRVPFKPREGRPVLCWDCFKKSRPMQ